MKALGFLSSDREQRQKWQRAFRIWQHRPYELKALSKEKHTCASCKTEFEGNYCPRCGQAAGVGRFSFKKAILLFLDVWGIGNRSMFRCIRDLLLRPGYMIRDYLSGMQSAYFPPFKMFFLLTALGLLVQHGLSLDIDDEDEKQEAQTEQGVPRPPVPPLLSEAMDSVDHAAAPDSVSGRMEYHWNSGDMDLKAQGEQIMTHPIAQLSHKFAKLMDSLREKNPAIFALLTLILFTVPLYYFWRKTPAIPDLRYSEFVVALVYTANMYSIYSIAGNLLNSSLLKFLAVVMVFVALKQFSGFSKKRVLGHLILTVVISIVILVAIFGAGVSTLYLATK